MGAGGEMVVATAGLHRDKPQLIDTVRTRPDMQAARASQDRLELAGAVGVLPLAADMADTVNAANSVERALAHQMAAAHATAMRFAAQAKTELDAHARNPLSDRPRSVEAARMAATRARLMDAFTRSALALDRLKNGGQQVVVVKHQQNTVVQEGGKAVVVAEAAPPPPGGSGQEGGEASWPMNPKRPLGVMPWRSLPTRADVEPEPGRVWRARRQQCLTADAGCTAAPAPARGPLKASSEVVAPGSDMGVVALRRERQRANAVKLGGCWRGSGPSWLLWNKVSAKTISEPIARTLYRYVCSAAGRWAAWRRADWLSARPTSRAAALASSERLSTLAGWLGRPVTKDEVRALTVETAGAIYRANYWDACCCSGLPAGVDLLVFDGAVNSGPNRSAKWLQAAVGVAQDGRIGPQTIRAVAAKSPADTIERITDTREAFYRGLGTFPTFGKGWLARLAHVKARALGVTV